MSAPRVLGSLLLLAWATTAAAQQAAPAERPAAPPAAVRLLLDDHPTIAFFDRAVRVELKGRFDADVADLGDAGGATGPEWSGRRVGVGVRVGRTIEGEVSRELEGSRPWRDVHVTWRLRNWLYARGGRFKVPFSEERVRSLTDQDFLERSLAARELAPGRDVGVLAGGRVGGRRLEWEAGVFEGRGDAWPGRTPLESTPASPLVAVRVGTRPVPATRRGPWRSLHVALAATDASRTGGLTGTDGRTVLDRRAYTLPVFVRGRERRLGLEAQWTPGPFRFRSEWMRLSQERLEQGLDAADLPPIEATGWHASAVYRLFHRRGDDRRPTTDWLRSGEVGVRIEGLAFRTRAGGSPDFIEVLPLPRHRAITAGTTWTLHRWIVVQVDVVHERLADAGIAVFAAGSRTSVGARWRLGF
jgi:hypothetical protein